MWSEKYRPKKLEEMVGNYEARERLLAWLKKWKKGGKAIMLVGPPGTGKTTTVQLAAKKLGTNLVQLNASDRRTRDMLSEKLGEALLSTNLFGERTLIFLDEVDGLAGRADYGAVDFIREAVRKSHNPVVMAANNPDADEVRKLSSVTSTLLFVRPSEDEVAGYLGKIARDEKLEVSKGQLKTFASSANGDIRAAINSMQAGAPAVKDVELTASQSLNAFFDSRSNADALRALRSYPGQGRDKVRELFVSVSRSKIHEDRKATALEVISRADVLLGRMMRGGNWRLLRYLDTLLASDLRTALGDGGVHYSTDSVPWPLQVRLWNDSRKLKDIGTLVAKRSGTSMRGALVEDIPYLMLLCNDERFRDDFVKSLDLEENYAAFVEKEAARTAGPSRRTVG